ncbi:Coatomer/calthrin adaptor appendage, C-terminal subdomain-containing protein [Lentinula boryana]|uniref:Coatomer/calthrin adaptor appendage, C-terminal subdomain-containing protein n=1 Tax=Lentinula boryana TaxID=40481 RepID=A0ABQ8PW81_9AGAR|nr:Coatomer/calthrin adaptor appendage, C-terminal subdomain-containing protein [Lentinula boryana]
MVRVYFVVEPNLSCLKTLIQTNGSAASHTATGAAPTLDVLGSLTGLDWGRTDGPSSSEQPNQAVGPNIDRWSNSDGGMSRYKQESNRVTKVISDKTLSVLFAKIPPNVIAPRTQELLHVEFKKAFSTPPILTVSFLAGSHQTTSIRLPIVLTKYLDHVKLGQADFFERWKLIGGAPRESHTGRLDLPKFRQAVIGHRFNLLNGIDPNPNNLVGAGVLHTVTSVEGKVGCLLRLDPKEAKLCRLTARTTSEDVAKEAQKLLQKSLQGGT